MKTQDFEIEGMTCHHCILTVRNALSELPFVYVEDVQLGRVTVRYDETKFSPLDFLFALDKVGYKVIL
ncbi:MAG: heavy-metal-associated domain-containing protein [Ignavibacteria bacterium]|nr:heavy-metal-associated domain-containing protein [Ignavibacteria bacterium]